MGARRCEDRGSHGAGGFIGPGWHGGRGDDLVVGGGGGRWNAGEVPAGVSGCDEDEVNWWIGLCVVNEPYCMIWYEYVLQVMI